MRTIALLTSLTFIAFWTDSIGQEVKPARKRTPEYAEEYTVLKDDKKIKHGQYARFRINVFDLKAVEIIGSFSQGQKTGTWLYFTRRGYLEQEGAYVDDLKEGFWTEFYEPVQQEVTTMKAINASFDVNQGITVSETGEISVNRSDITKAAEGNYHLGKKVGTWVYYDLDGRIVHSYDHSTDSLLVNRNKDNCTYLGGFPRLYSQVRELHLFMMPRHDSHVSFQLPADPSEEQIRMIKCIGDCTTAAKFKEILEQLSSEFIKGAPAEISFIFEMNEQGLVSKFRIEFKSADFK